MKCSKCGNKIDKKLGYCQQCQKSVVNEGFKFIPDNLNSVKAPPIDFLKPSIDTNEVSDITTNTITEMPRQTTNQGPDVMNIDEPTVIVDTPVTIENNMQYKPETIMEPVVEPIDTPVIEPVVPPVVEPIVEPISEPVFEPTPEPVVSETPQMNIAESLPEIKQEEIYQEPTNNVVSEPQVEPVNEPQETFVINESVDTQPTNNITTEPVQEVFEAQSIEPIQEPVVEPTPQTFEPVNNVMPMDQNMYTNNQQSNSIDSLNTQPVQDYELPIDNGDYEEPKKKKKLLPILIIIGIIVGVCLIVLLASSILKDNPEEKPNNNVVENTPSEDLKGTRTIMVYIIGSDLESSQGSATSDVLEMIESNFNQEDLNVVVYAGGTKKWQNNVFSTTENAIYEIEGTNTKKLKTYGVKDMTDPSTLTEFINYVNENYKTDLYSLILWDHGGGPMLGYGSDENFANSQGMQIIEIDKAINDSALDKKLEFIGFDACLMSSIEVANTLKEEAHYLIASSETEPGQGWDYTFLKNINKNTTTTEVGKTIIDSYMNYYKSLKSELTLYGYSYDPLLTLTMTDLNKLGSVVTSIDNLFKNLDSNINITSYSKLTRYISKTVTYGYQSNASTQYDLVDLYDFADDLEGYDKESKELQDSLNNSIVYHKSNIKSSYGLSMYFPITTKRYYTVLDTNYNYSKVIVSDNYKKFLTRYIGIANGDRLVKSNINNLNPQSTLTDISADIPEDIANNYQSAHYIVFRKMKDGSYLPIYKSTDVAIQGNKIIATVANRRLSVCNNEGKECEDVIAIEIARDENYITYSIISTIQYWDEDDFLNTFEMDAIDITFKVDRKTNEGTITDIKPIVKEGEPVPKITYNLNDWSYIQFSSSSYFLYDDNGKKLDEWKNSGTMYGSEVKIKDGFKILVNELDKDEEHYYMFMIKDTQENVYESDLVKEAK